MFEKLLARFQKSDAAHANIHIAEIEKNLASYEREAVRLRTERPHPTDAPGLVREKIEEFKSKLARLKRV